MTAAVTADDRLRPGAASRGPGSRYRIPLLAAAVIAACAAYCFGHTLLAGGVVDPWLSVSWAASTVAPWFACWPLLRRAVLRSSEGRLRWRSVLVPLAGAAVASALLERADALLFGVEHGPTLAELVFRKLPIVTGFALAAWLHVRLARPRTPGHAARDDREPSIEVATRSGSIQVRSRDIDWVRAAGNYLEVYTGGSCHLIRRTLHGFAADGGDRFLRIHRSVLVNRERVIRLEPHPRGRLVVRLQDGCTLPVGRGFRPEVERVLGG